MASGISGTSSSSSPSDWNMLNWFILELEPYLLLRTLLKPLLPETYFLSSGEAFACPGYLTKLWFYSILCGPGNKLPTLANPGASLWFGRNILLSMSSYWALDWLLIDCIDLIDLYERIMAGISSQPLPSWAGYLTEFVGAMLLGKLRLWRIGAGARSPYW